MLIYTFHNSDFESSTSNHDREMDAIFEQTKSFEKVWSEIENFQSA